MAVNTCCFGSIINVTADRNSVAEASVSGYGLTGNPQLNTTAIPLAKGAHIDNATALDEVIFQDNLGSDYRMTATADANQMSTMDQTGVTASGSVGVSIDQRGQQWLAPTHAFTSFSYGFEVSDFATYSFSINFVVDPGALFNAPLSAVAQGPFGMIIMDSSHSETITGNLGPGNYNVTFYADMHGDAATSNLTQAHAATFDVQFALASVPDAGASLLLGLIPIGLMLQKRSASSRVTKSL